MTAPSPDPAFLTLKDEELLLLLLYGECRGCTPEEQQAVACSVRNRVGSGRWFGGTDYKAVILRPAQYDALWPALGGPNYNTTLGFAHRLVERPQSVPGAPYERRLVDIAHACITGTLLDPTHGATHYYDESIKPPIWTAPPAEESLVAGRLHFYRHVA